VLCISPLAYFKKIPYGDRLDKDDLALALFPKNNA